MTEKKEKELPTQMDILALRLKQRECEHEWLWTDYSRVGGKTFRHKWCRQCGRSVSEELMPPSLLWGN